FFKDCFLNVFCCLNEKYCRSENESSLAVEICEPPKKEKRFFCVRCISRKLSLSCGKNKLGKTPQARYELRQTKHATSWDCAPFAATRPTEHLTLPRGKRVYFHCGIIS